MITNRLLGLRYPWALLCGFVILVALMSVWVTHTYSIISKNIESLAHFHYRRGYKMIMQTYQLQQSSLVKGEDLL
jgi:hypothetical protein